jgi:hypothetical protein
VAKKEKKIDHSMQSEPIHLGTLPASRKTPNLKAKEKKENKKPNHENPEITEYKPTFLSEYYNVHTRQFHPCTLKFVEREAIKLKEWADQEDSLNIYDFTDNQGYNPDTFYDWCKKFPQLHEAHQYALRRIGSRREYGAMIRKFTEATVHRTLGYYHYIWKQETIALAKLKEETSQNETKVVIIERFPDLPTKTPEEVA